MTARWLAAGGLLVLACNAERPAEINARLPPGVAARIGGEDIGLGSVQQIADAERIPLAMARERAIGDALLSLEARRLLVEMGYARVAERATRARSLLGQLKIEVAAQGPPTDQEVERLSAERWQDVDRPETVRVTHAVVRVQSPADDAAAHAAALRVRAAVLGAGDPDDFIRRAQAVEHGALELRAERLPAMTPDGRGYFPEGAPDNGSASFDQEFAHAASVLAVGALSEPVKTRFGYHVIRCEARLPEQRVPFEVRRRVMQDEIWKQRAERAKDALLAELNHGVQIQVARAADDLTSRVKVTE